MNKSKKNKMYCLLSYVYIFWIVALFSERKDPKVRFHVNQGIILFVVISLIWISLKVVCAVLLSISKVFAIITSLLNLLFLIMIVTYISIGIYNVLKDREKKLPLFGGLFDFLQ